MDKGLNIVIRKMKVSDAKKVAEMMRTFYASPAVMTDGSPEIFKADIEGCLGDSPYLEGYVFDKDGEICGYAMLAKSFSTEFGKKCIWIEDLYIREDMRGVGLGTRFFRMIEKLYPEHIFRLEVEEDNTRAVYVYEKNGFERLPYTEMIKL